jgi:hypothetical protein
VAALPSRPSRARRAVDRSAAPRDHEDRTVPPHDVTCDAPTGVSPAHTETLPPIVDWQRTARRLRAILLVLGVVVLVGWLAAGLLGDGLQLRLLGELVGIGLLVAFVAEVVIVGGSAVRGVLVAGERGHRLSLWDVSLIPPQLRRGGCGCDGTD